MPVRGVRGRMALGALVLMLAILALLAIAGPDATMMLAPGALLLALLFLGRYPGEQVIHRLAGLALPRPSRRIARPRGPRFLGMRLAGLAVPGRGRAPPLPALT